MTDDPFLAKLRNDARPLRYEPDEATLSRIHAAIQSRVEQSHLNARNAQPTVAQLLAAWFRPIVATAAAIALAAAIGINVVRTDSVSLSDTVLEISVGGETYRVGD
jgi:anti-sigma-K factor RskA